MRADDEADFVQFVSSNSPRLLRTAWFLCGDRALAEDLVQGVLERMYVRWSRIRADDAYGCARAAVANSYLDHLRRHRREIDGPVPEVAAAGEPSMARVDLIRALAA